MADDRPQFRAELQRALVFELERRLAELAHCEETAFGAIGWRDAVLVGICFLLAPLLAIWIAA